MVPTPALSLNMLIRKLESISRLSDEERRAIERLPITGRHLAAHQDIVREKDRPSQCCLLLEGWACRYQLLSEGKRQIFSFHIPGDIPDLQSLHLKVMDHSVCTVTQATVAFIPHEALRELTAAFPGIAAILWRDTLVDGAIFREWMTGIGRRSALEAVAHLLCELYVKLEAVGLARDHAYRLPLTQADLGDALGLSNVHVNRTLRDLRDNGLITLHGGKLQIDRWQELTGLCDFDATYLHLDRGAV
ncbi:Crp/Fnr family transcriptional regulator [Methylobacterium terricola]|uniref:Crp/Fnr family transcriptional regulator n=1 Tax=Methylobacterium terricola TaxID=2583531 RepID=A0A5C4L8K6_9HYPH|nr:Crp/Fnr family transcriptional regulator [Methylobacterium terricola]TNC06527.1 Crp/Fnr family transcriptional regulator [Methylobacterium terricola]